VSVEKKPRTEYPAIRCTNCRYQREGAHYNIWVISSGGVDGLRQMFGNPPEANEMNFALFSTSGVHGSYTTIEEIEESLLKYGEHPAFLEDESEETMPDDWYGNDLTVTVYHPRIIGVGYGNVKVGINDIQFLKALRQSSWDAVLRIGRSDD
jgi:hypothetical protein